MEFVDTCQVVGSIDRPTQEVLMQLAILRDHQTEVPSDRREDNWGKF